MHQVAIIGWLFILFLITINFLNQINDVMVNFLYYTLFLVVLLKHKVTFNLEFVVLLTFATIYFFIYRNYRDVTKWTHVKYWLGAPGMYLMGKLFISQKTEKWFQWVIYTVTFGLFFYGFLNMLNYVQAETPEGTRFAFDFWDGFMMNAPLMGVYFTGFSTLLIYNIFHLSIKKHWYLKLIQLFGMGLTVYFIILLANRTYFIVTILVFIIMFFIASAINRFKVLYPTLIVVVLIGIIYYGYQFNVFNVQTTLEATRWYRRIILTMENGILSDGRFKVYPLIREQLFLYPAGGYQLDLGGLHYAHNLWLDILHAVGTYGFFPFLGYTALIIYTLIRLSFSYYVPKGIKVLVISVYIGYFLNFSVEPILEGVPYIFFLFCLINGATYQYYKVRVHMKIKEDI